MNDFVGKLFLLRLRDQTASPNSIVTFNLPESALIHLPSIRFFFDVTTTSETEGSASLLVAFQQTPLVDFKLEVYIGESRYKTVSVNTTPSLVS